MPTGAMASSCCGVFDRYWVERMQAEVPGVIEADWLREYPDHLFVKPPQSPAFA